ncbi:hypothetical protein RIF29_17048 [Crotalaria pallida]|uniref:Uncharacterized protein n=1 Tax=Crotalaria pallida TaxID=3830 RepID=A0AAN9FGE7_CROPI
MVGFKNRYMVMEVFLNPNRDQVAVAPIILTRSNVTAAIKDSILLNFGECGLGSALGAFQVKYLNSDTNLCVIRTSREDHQKVWCAITMITNIASYPVIFNMLDLSGLSSGLLFLAAAARNSWPPALGSHLRPSLLSWLRFFFLSLTTHRSRLRQSSSSSCHCSAPASPLLPPLLG